MILSRKTEILDYNFPLIDLLEACPEELSVLNTESTAADMISKIVEKYPGIKAVIFCSSCKTLRTHRTPCPTVEILLTGVHGSPICIEETYLTQPLKCDNPNWSEGEKTFTRKLSDMWLIIEVLNVSTGKLYFIR